MAASESQARADHFQEATRWIEELTDQPFLRATFAYGGELRLHFGRAVPYDNDRMSGRRHGEWVLSLRATPWVLAAEGALLSRSLDEQQHALRHFEELEGKQVSATRLRRKDLAVTIRFEDGAWFTALTEPRANKSRLALWELLTPSGLFVLAWPDRSIAIEAPAASPPAEPQAGGDD
jgi:hypothetical protein